MAISQVIRPFLVLGPFPIPWQASQVATINEWLPFIFKASEQLSELPSRLCLLEIQFTGNSQNDSHN